MTKQITYKIHLVLGSILCGKSSYIEANFPVDKGQSLTRVFIGRWIREAIGLEPMKKDPNPNQCDCTEPWVRKHVEGAFATRDLLQADMVFDGYPRSVSQVEWLFRILNGRAKLYSEFPEIIVHSLVVPHVELTNRLHTRSKGNETAAEFDRIRLARSRRDVESVLDRIQELSKEKWAGTRLPINLNIKVIKDV